MEVESARSHFLAPPIREQTPETSSEGDSLPSDDYEFDPSQCLFCNRMSRDQDQNILHMSKAHGLHVDSKNLIVDVESLLAYFHLVISGCYECLYCGTQRNTRQAVQQHMMAKGHCKYDIEDKDAEIRDFYEFPTEDVREDVLQHRNPPGMRFSSDDPQLLGLPSQARLRRRRPSKRSDRLADEALQTRTLAPQSHGGSDGDDEGDSHSSTQSATPAGEGRELSTRARKQECTLNNQLAHLRAEDRRSLLHLPPSQQRALLAAHHKQEETVRRTEQTQRGNLETAGNKVNCLGKIRLIRKPPHTGNIHSLNR